jgi:predicted membrane metal-binding protein
VNRRNLDRPSLVAGTVVVALGVLLLLDFGGVLDLGFEWLVPAVLAAVGAMLLTTGLEGARRP